MKDVAAFISLLVQFNKEHAAEQFKLLPPEGDLHPMMTFIDGLEGMHVIEIHNDYLENGSTKDNLAIRLCVEARKRRAVGSVMVAHTWLRPKDGVTNARGGIAGLPGTKEVLAIQEISPAGLRLYCADVIREPRQPPRLGEWEEGTDVDRESRFSYPLRTILSANYSALAN